MSFTGQELTSANTAYSPIPDTTPTTYSQPTYIANLLGQIHKANESLLSKFEIQIDHKDLPIPLQSNISLARLAELGSRDPDIAWPIFQAFWAEITSPGLPPILFSLDGLGHVMKYSAYRSPNYELIHAHDLALVKLFADHLSGKRTLPNGGAIVAATTKSNNPVSPTIELSILQALQRRAEMEVTKADPYVKYDARSLETLKNMDVLRVGGLNKLEARGLMEYWAASGVLRSRVDQQTVSEHWTLAGNGIAGEIERGVLRMHI